MKKKQKKRKTTKRDDVVTTAAKGVSGIFIFNSLMLLSILVLSKSNSLRTEILGEKVSGSAISSGASIEQTMILAFAIFFAILGIAILIVLKKESKNA